MSRVIAHLKGLVENQVWNGNDGFIKVCSKLRFWSLADWDVVEYGIITTNLLRSVRNHGFGRWLTGMLLKYGMVTTDLLRSVRNHGFGRWLTGMLLSMEW